MKSYLFISLLMIISISAFCDDSIKVFKGARVYFATSSTDPIHVDGKLTDHAWKTLSPSSLQQSDINSVEPYFKTEFNFISSKELIYFYFKSMDENIDKIKSSASNRDEISEGDDAIYLFLQSSEEKSPTYLFIFYPNGQVCDIKIEEDKEELKSDLNWNLESLSHFTSLNKKDWTVEGKISVTDLFGKSLKKISHFRCNIMRVRPQKGWDDAELSAFHFFRIDNKVKPSELGYLYLESLKQKVPQGVLKQTPVANLKFNNLNALEVPLVDKEIQADGDLSDLITSGKVSTMNFSPIKGNEKIENNTEAWVATTKSEIIIGARCHEKSMVALYSKERMRDEPLWGDDSIEIFLRVGDGVDKDYYHIAVNSNGSIYDSSNGDISWNGEGIVAAVKKDKSYWSLEIKIPFINLNMAKAKTEFGNPWRFNLIRHRPARLQGEKIEESAWSPTNSENSHVPERFGYLFMQYMGAKLPKN